MLAQIMQNLNTVSYKFLNDSKILQFAVKDEHGVLHFACAYTVLNN